jgi:hypothetical protein
VGLRRLERPLRRSRRRHQLKAQENLGRPYRPQELEQLTCRLVAVLQPKIRRHGERLTLARQRRRSAADRLLSWLRGGTLPQRRGGRRAVRRLYRHLGGYAQPLQKRRRQLQQRRGDRREGRHLLETQQWLTQLQEEAARSQERHRLEEERHRQLQEEGGGLENSAEAAIAPVAPSEEERRLERQDQRSEERAFAQISARLEALERVALEPLTRGRSALPPRRLRRSLEGLRRRGARLRRRLARLSSPQWLERLEQRRRELWASLKNPTAGQWRRLQPTLLPGWRGRLARALRRWRRNLLRQLQFWALLHPLLKNPDRQRAQRRALRQRDQREEEDWRQRSELQEQARRARGSYKRSGLGGPREPAQSTTEELRQRWRRFFEPPLGDGFRRFEAFSNFTKGGLFS